MELVTCKKSHAVTSNGLFRGVDSCLIRLVLGKKFLAAVSNELFQIVDGCLIRLVLVKMSDIDK